MLIGQTNRLPVTTGQGFRFAMGAVTINRTDGVNDVFGRQMTARGDDRLPSRKPANLSDDLPAFGENCGPSAAVDRAIHATAAQKR